LLEVLCENKNFLEINFAFKNIVSGTAKAPVPRLRFASEISAFGSDFAGSTQPQGTKEKNI